MKSGTFIEVDGIEVRVHTVASPTQPPTAEINLNGNALDESNWKKLRDEIDAAIEREKRT